MVCRACLHVPHIFLHYCAEQYALAVAPPEIVDSRCTSPVTNSQLTVSFLVSEQSFVMVPDSDLSMSTIERTLYTHLLLKQRAATFIQRRIPVARFAAQTCTYSKRSWLKKHSFGGTSTHRYMSQYVGLN